MEKKNQEQKQVRIELTEEQRQKIREATGKDAAAVEFTAEELEQRIAPARFVA
jgi:Spy/CpxP family protein refolding chaperone